MENLRSSPDATHMSDVSSHDDSANTPVATTSLAGEFSGLKLTAVTKEQPKIFSSVGTDALKEAHLKKEDNTQLHPFVQVHPSTSMSSLRTESSLASDSSPTLNRERELNLRGIAERRSLLKEKIGKAQEVIHSSSQSGYRDFNECQQSYVKNLEQILESISDLPSQITEGEEETISTIESTVDRLINLAEELKKHTEAIITDRITQKERPYRGAVGELMESFVHYLSYIQNLKTGNNERVDIEFCLAKKCLAKFKSLEAQGKGDQKAGNLFHKAFSCYSKALEKGIFGEESFEEAGDSFFSAGTMLHHDEEGLSRLYEEAGTCFEKANQPCMSQLPAEILRHNQISDYWALSGNNTINAIRFLQLRKTSVFELYHMSRECFQRVAERLSLTDRNPKIQDEITALDQAGNHFASAAEAIASKEPKQADLYRLLGLCYRSKADAFSQKNTKSIGYFEKAESIINNTLFSLLKEVGPSEKRYQSAYQSIGTSYYMAGKAMQRGTEKEAALHEKAAQCYEELLGKSHDESSSNFLKQGAQYYTEAASSLQKTNATEATRYELAGDCKCKAAQAQHPDAVTAWNQAAASYFGMIAEEKRNSHRDTVIQLFNSTAQYNKIVAKIIEESFPEDDETLTSLTAASRNLFLAAGSMEKGDQELASAYENCAISHHHLVMARSSDMLEKFPVQFQMGFKKETQINPSLIKYWTNIAIKYHHKIEELLALREARSNEEH